MEFSHKELLEIAYKWALKRHAIVLKEKGAVYENPDILAFGYSFTTLVEAKSNRTDFLRDKRKLPRHNEDFAVGNYRIYCVPKGLLTEDDIPQKWGLLEVFPSGYARLKTNIYKNGVNPNFIWWHELTISGHKAEKRMLYNAYFRLINHQ